MLNAFKCMIFGHNDIRSEWNGEWFCEYCGEMAPEFMQDPDFPNQLKLDALFAGVITEFGNAFNELRDTLRRATEGISEGIVAAMRDIPRG